MKNVLHSLLVVVTVLFMTACSEDQLSNERGNEENVTFTTNLAGAIQSKAFGDGTTAKTLIYKVYNENMEELTGLGGTQEINLSTTVNFQLVKGEKYHFLFWAQEENAPYVIGDKGVITVNYDGVAANDEKRDAFYGIYTIESVSGSIEETITLKRPFAQLNIATDDLEAAGQSGITVSTSKVTVTGLANTLNPFTGEATYSGEGTLSVTFNEAGVPASTETITVDGTSYANLAMNYLLIPMDPANAAEQALVDITAAITHSKGTVDLTVSNAPVKANYRTNVIGSLLSSNAGFKIVIDGTFNEPAYKNDQLRFVFANGGTIELTEDVTLTEPLVVAAGKNVVFNLNGHTLNGALNVSENARLTVNEGEIVNMDENVSAIISNGALILNDVKITSARHALRIESGSVVINGGYYTVDPQSKMTLYALNVGDDGTVANVTIKGGTFIGPKGTIADSGAAVGVKAGSTVTIEGGNFSGGKNNTLSNKGTLTVNGGIFDQDPSQYVAEGYQAVQVGDHYLVVPATTISASNVESFTAALNNPEVGVVELEEKIENVGLGFEVKRDVVFNMDNKEFNAGSDANSKWYAIQAYGENEVVINNANFTRAGIAALDGADVVFNSGVINHKPERSSRYIFLAGGEGSTVTINDGTFTNDRAKNSYFYAYNNGTIYVKGGTFNGVKSNNKIVTDNGGNVIITGGTFNFDPSDWVAEGYKATKSGDTWTVSAVQ